jgi:hypothetical protein
MDQETSTYCKQQTECNKVLTESGAMPRRGVFLVAALAITVEAAPLKPLARGFWDDGVSQPINPALASPPSPSPLPHVPTSPRRKPFETDDAGVT